MEDEDYFLFSDDILINSTEKLQFRDTAIYLNSSADGQLDIVADTEIQLAATTIDINGAVDISGALTLAGVSLAETISDTVGAMVSSNTETGVTVTYDDSDNTLDFVIGTLNQDTTGNAATATALETARTIHGVSFDGTANIDLSEVIQDTVGAMVSSNTESGVTVTYEDSDGTMDFVVPVKDEDNMASNSDTHLATQQSIKAYVDTQLTAEDLDITADSGGPISVDLDSDTLDIEGGTGVDTTASSNKITVAIDSSVATLTGTQELTNKTINAENNSICLSETPLSEPVPGSQPRRLFCSLSSQDSLSQPRYCPILMTEPLPGSGCGSPTVWPHPSW